MGRSLSRPVNRLIINVIEQNMVDILVRESGKVVLNQRKPMLLSH
jgi:hypothetical protein